MNVVPVPVAAARYFTKCPVPGIYPVFTHLPYFPGIYPTPRPGTGMRCCTRIPSIVAWAYITYRSFGYGYERRTELT